jgi:hypothetical protein
VEREEEASGDAEERVAAAPRGCREVEREAAAERIAWKAKTTNHH